MASRKPPDFGTTKRLQRGYEQGMRQISGRVILQKRPEQTYQQWLVELTARSQQPDIQAASKLLAERLVLQANVINARTWREAASRVGQGYKLHAWLKQELEGTPTGARVQQLIRENASLISSVPLEAARTLVDEVAKAQQNGARPATIAKMARKRFPELLRSRVNLISRTETAKASTALTEARCERLGVEWYIWESSKDKRTRASHKKMHGVVVPWGQAPSPEALIGEKTTLGHYHAGECPNCRCVVIPILTLDDVAFPVRVYWNGRVQTMNRQQFKKISAVEERQAA